VQHDGARGNGGRRDESGIPKMSLIGRARSGVVRPDQGQEVTGLGGSQARTNKQYSGQIQANLGGWRGRVGGLNQARVIEYLIGDDMRLFLLRALPAMWTQLG
jgi:hypothetical protein